MEDIRKAFDTRSKTIADFFRERGVAFSIPLYQREYSWDKDNIDQLIEDISFGVEHLLEDENEIRFMGTIIVVSEKDRTRICSDERAQPARIDNVIDGQQRISTIAMLATLLYQRLKELSDRLPGEDPYDDLKKAVTARMEELRDLFSIDLGHGSPQYKPVVIRESTDSWRWNDPDDKTYVSDVSSYLARFIRAIHDDSDFPKLTSKGLVASNLKQITEAIQAISLAHSANGDKAASDFPPAWTILDKIDEKYIWTYSRPELKKVVLSQQKDTVEESSGDALCSLIQVLAFSHYLMQRCCFTVIDTATENWAFDMFQSLNATGTPLTALETFKPMVVNLAKQATNEDYVDTKIAKDFGRVDRLFEDSTSASAKNRLTNEYLTALALIYNGTKLARQFSRQRAWLTSIYKKLDNPTDQELLIKQMGDLAEYFWAKKTYKVNDTPFLGGFPSGVNQEHRAIATTCVRYLDKSNHKMANTVLGRFYSQMLNGDAEAGNEFVEACKAVAAFFTLWRSALPNTGLDDVYRQLFREKDSQQLPPISWGSNPNSVQADDLKQYFREALKKNGVGTETEWITKAQSRLRADEAKQVCRFALFIAAEDTISDSDRPGLMIAGTKDSSRQYLTPEMWEGKEYTIEHIAPQEPFNRANWSNDLYEDASYQLVGNLTLLPDKVNKSASNHDWNTKWIYYSHLAETRRDVLNELAAKAKQLGVQLNQSTIELLQSAKYNQHIAPIVTVGIDGIWNLDLVKDRTQRICEILWNRLWSDWLESARVY